MGFWTKSDDKLNERMHRAERLIDELRLDLGDLAEKHLKLRGKIYALKMHKPEEAAADVPRAMTRDELRRSLATSGRFIPGKAPKHD